MGILSKLRSKDGPPEDRMLLGLLLWFAVTFAAAAFGAAFKPGQWYASLNKPTWTPPSALFGPVWTALYAMMSVAAWLVWKRGGFEKQSVPLNLFLAQLALNAAWSPMCFGLHSLLLSSVNIVLLWLTLLLTARSFFGVTRAAGWLLVPCQIWVSYATALNIALWLMNRPT
jgi:tryptophan-rich sensory protein